MEEKKVLVVAYFFPPQGGAGSIRITKFVKYLPEFKWTPVVLTPAAPERHLPDLSLLNEVPKSVKIIRTSSFEPTKWTGSKKYLIPRNDRTSKGAAQVLPLSQLKRWIINFIRTWLFIPDSRIGWLPFAVARGIHAVFSNKITVIMATGGPWTSLLVGLLISFFSRKPLVSDFRDPWTEFVEHDTRPRARKVIDSFLEYLVLKQSHLVLFVTDELRAAFCRKYPRIKSEKFVVLRNGYDESDFSSAQKESIGKCLITYTGSFNEERRAAFFLNGLKECVRLRPDLKNNIQVKLFGTIEASDRALIGESGLGEMIQPEPFIGHGQVANYLINSSILLVSLPDLPLTQICLPIKIYEYLRSGVPILAVMPQTCPSATLIKSAAAGVVVEPNDAPKIARAIIDLYDQFKQGGNARSINHSFISRFERRRLTRVLSSFLDAVAGV